MSTNETDINQMLTEAGFSVEFGSTALTKKDDWGGQIVGTTPFTLMYEDHEVHSGEYSRGLGHFDGIPKQPEDPEGVFDRKWREEQIASYTNAITRLDILYPAVEYLQKGDSETNLIQYYTHQLKVHERNRELNAKNPHLNKRVLSKLLVTKYESALELLKEYYPLLRRCLRNAGTFRRAMLYKQLYLQCRNWYERAIKKHEDAIAACVQYEKDLSDWERSVIGKIVQPDPTLEEIVYSIVCVDATEETFENWCADYGYNDDSIKDHNLWITCRNIGRRVDEAGIDMDWIHELFQDY